MYCSGMVAFFSLLYFATPLGLGLSPDSVAYLRAAKDYLFGNGFQSFTSQWPPLYPLLIILTSEFFGKNIIVGSRILQALVFSANFSALYFLIRNYANPSRLISIILSGLLCLQGVMTYIHFYAWTESLFVLFILLDLVFLSKIIQPKIIKINALNCILLILATAAIYTRYIGFTVAILNALVILLMPNKDHTKRLMLSASQVLIPLLIIAPWLLHRSSFQNANTDRTFAFNALSSETLLNSFGNIGRWLVPNALTAESYGGYGTYSLLGALIFLLFFLLLFLQIIFIFNKNSTLYAQISKRVSVVFPLVLFVLVYFSSILFFIVFVDKKIIPDNRILAPIFLPLIVCLFSLFINSKKKIVQFIGLVSIFASLSFFYPELRARLLISYFNGIELNSKSERERPITVFLKTCMPNLKLGSDAPWHYDLYFEPKVQWLPQQILFGSGFINNNYKKEISQFEMSLNMIVIEDKSSQLVNEINALSTFQMIYDDDAYVWINTNMNVSNFGCF